MKSLKKSAALVLIFTTFLLICSCGAEPAKTSMNYEMPIITMGRAINALDSESYFNCFTAGAKQAYAESDNYNPEIVKTMLPSLTSSKSLFKAKVISSQELDKDEINQLAYDYKNRYKMRIDITKAYKLTVEFGTIQNNTEQLDTRELTTVRIENTWFIYGDLIENFNFENA